MLRAATLFAMPPRERARGSWLLPLSRARCAVALSCYAERAIELRTLASHTCFAESIPLRLCQRRASATPH